MPADLRSSCGCPLLPKAEEEEEELTLVGSSLYMSMVKAKVMLVPGERYADRSHQKGP